MTGKVSKNRKLVFIAIIMSNFSISSDNLCQPQEVVRGCKPFVHRGFDNLTTYLKKILMFCIYFCSVRKMFLSELPNIKHHSLVNK